MDWMEGIQWKQMNVRGMKWKKVKLKEPNYDINICMQQLIHRGEWTYGEDSLPK